MAPGSLCRPMAQVWLRRPGCRYLWRHCWEDSTGPGIVASVGCHGLWIQWVQSGSRGVLRSVHTLWTLEAKHQSLQLSSRNSTSMSLYLRAAGLPSHEPPSHAAASSLLVSAYVAATSFGIWVFSQLLDVAPTRLPWSGAPDEGPESSTQRAAGGHDNRGPCNSRSQGDLRRGPGAFQALTAPRPPIV